MVRQQEWPGCGGYKYEYHYKYKYKYQGRRTEGRYETARITWLREIGVDTGATDCQIFTHFKQNKFIEKNHQWIILFIYYNLFLFATKWLYRTSRDWIVGRSFSGW